MTVHAPSLAIGAAIAAVAIIGIFYVMEEMANEAVFTTSNIEQSEAEKEQDTLRQESPQAITMSVLYDNGSPYLGNPDAPITIVEFGDYQCFFCNKFFHDTEGMIYDNYIKTGKAKMIFKDFTIIGQDSVTAAHAAHCAGEQEMFWEYHDMLYNNWDGENNGWASEENQYKFAQKVGLDESAFKECMASGKFYSLIEASSEDARKLGLTGTPGFFIIGENNRIVRIPGAQPYEVFVNVLESPELKSN
ncbi:MAG: DsbA family protein [Candidatus Nitrosotenuis sp.]